MCHFSLGALYHMTLERVVCKSRHSLCSAILVSHILPLCSILGVTGRDGRWSWRARGAKNVIPTPERATVAPTGMPSFVHAIWNQQHWVSAPHCSQNHTVLAPLIFLARNWGPSVFREALYFLIVKASLVGEILPGKIQAVLPPYIIWLLTHYTSDLSSSVPPWTLIVIFE